MEGRGLVGCPIVSFKQVRWSRQDRMATYILLINLTPEGQAKAVRDPHYLLHVEQAVKPPGVEPLGLYAVLGAYDFVSIVEAESNEKVARFALQLGLHAGVRVSTLPAVPVARLEVEPGDQPGGLVDEVALTPDRQVE
jgi:uncharacterized protein with GYD domain